MFIMENKLLIAGNKKLLPAIIHKANINLQLKLIYIISNLIYIAI